MKHIAITLSLLFAGIMSSYAAGKADAAKDYVPEPYTWTTMSANSSESMPCGGHDIGMNVWVENGDLLFYACQSGWFDENNTLLKAGRFRLHFSEPFTNDGFSQTLDLYNGCVIIKDKKHEVKLWTEVFEPIIKLQIVKGSGNDAVFSYESWRFKDVSVTKDACQQTSWKWNIPKDCMTFADDVKAEKNSLTFVHQNKAETVFDYTVNKEGLDSVKSQLYNPIGNLRMEGKISAPGFTFLDETYGLYASTPFKAYNFAAQRVKKSLITISLAVGCKEIAAKEAAAEGVAAGLSGQPSSVDRGRSGKSGKSGKSERSERSDKSERSGKAARTSQQWWHEYWQRSWIKTTAPEAKEMVRNYELFRFMLGCNAFGRWPSKFNGGLFTFDPVYEDEKAPFTPDYRKWGGGTMTAQNQRLVYWPMLKSGDFDMMRSQFDTYLRLLPNATLRTKCYWGHDGASFSEQIENFGLPNPAEYGKHKPGEDMGNERNAWLEYQWDTVLEFCQMILDANRYSGMDISGYEPLIEQSLKFFDLHYRYLAKQRGVKDSDADGKLILYPSSGCETFKMAYNPSSVVAALKSVSLSYFGYKNDSAYHKLYLSIPDIPIKDDMIQPAVVWARVQNVETPQLYPVFPWRMFGVWQESGVGKDSLRIARNTYLNDAHAVKMRSIEGWKQDNIWAACLGLTEEAARMNVEKFANGPYRFPAFWNRGYDWSPDLNRGGAAMIGLQEMLLQESPSGEVLICPAWPKGWNVEFKLHSSKGVVMGRN